MADGSSTKIAIIGTGFAGLGTAIRLKQEGEHDFLLLERADEVGGTWRDNSYPGCAVDVQSHLYSFSFAPNPGWTQLFSPQREIWEYQRKLVEDWDLRAHIRFGHEVLSGDWDDVAGRWTLQTSGGAVDAQFVLSGMGPLSNPIPPEIPGLDTFAGTMFHSAQWDHDHDLRGRRVAAIGTGSSAAQFVPRIAPEVGHLSVFQRTPGWIFPRLNRKVTRFERQLYTRFPKVQAAVRRKQFVQRELMGLVLKDPNRAKLIEVIAKKHLERQVKDPALRSKLLPTYRAGCKRIIVSDDWYPALTRENVDVVTDRITEVRPEGVVTADGTVHEVDTIILGTGFEIMPVADPLRGRDGRSLTEYWNGRREAYLGTAVANFPNYFMLVGPNTGTGHTSVLLYAEAQIEYLLGLLAHVDRVGATAIEVREERQRSYSAAIRERLKGSTWMEGGCNSWYLNDDGGSSVIWPGSTWQFLDAVGTFSPGDYVVETAPERAPVAA